MEPARIVLVEDNPGDVFLVELALKDSGIRYDLTKFESGSDAVGVLCSEAEANAPTPDAILLDLNTPRTDGFDALRRLKNTPRLSGVPIAVITSSKASSDMRRAGLLGAGYIHKPSQLEEFLSVVGRAVSEMLRLPPKKSHSNQGSSPHSASA